VQQQVVSYGGHAGLVGNVRFMNHGKTLISVGAEDSCVLQWRTVDA
jgi:hypothetical protein